MGKMGENVLCPFQIIQGGLLGCVLNAPTRINAHLQRAIWRYPEAYAIEGKRLSFAETFQSDFEALVFGSETSISRKLSNAAVHLRRAKAIQA